MPDRPITVAVPERNIGHSPDTCGSTGSIANNPAGTAAMPQLRAAAGLAPLPAVAMETPVPAATAELPAAAAAVGGAPARNRMIRAC